MVQIPDSAINALLKAAGSQGASAPRAVIAVIPPSLVNTPPGTLVNAVVTEVGKGGNITLQTPNGLLAIQTTLPLQKGSTLEFQLINPGKELQLLLLSANGKPVVNNPTQQNVTQTGGNPGGLLEEGVLFTSTPKTVVENHTQVKQPVPAAPATRTESSGFQQGNVIQTTLVNVQDSNFKNLLDIFVFDKQTGKFIPAPTGNTVSTPVQANSPTLPNNGVGAVVSFRVVGLTLPSLAANVQVNTPIVASNINTGSITATFQPNNTVTATPPAQQAFSLQAASAFIAPSPSQVLNTQTALPVISGGQVIPANINIPVAGNEITQPVPTTFTAQPVADPLSQAAIPTPNTPAPVTPNILTATPVNINPQTPLPTSAQPTPQALPSAPLPNVIPQAPATQALPLLNATVINAEKSGATLLQTPIGTVQLNFDTPLPKNTVLQLEAVAVIPPPTFQPGFAAIANKATSDGIPQLMKHWGSLEETVNTVQKANPQLGAKLQENLPVPDKQFGAKIIHFMNALQTGSVAEWLGQAVLKTLRQEKKTELLTQLTKEFATLRAAFAETPSTNWQSLIFPVLSEGQLHQARLYIRNMRDEQKKNQQGREQGADARFVVEVELEKLGEMQFDGLVKHSEDGKFFDLVIRSREKLDSSVIQDIIDIFTTTQEVTGLKGRVGFEHTSKFPVNPTQEMLGMGGGGSIVV